MATPKQAVIVREIKMNGAGFAAYRLTGEEPWKRPA